MTFPNLSPIPAPPVFLPRRPFAGQEQFVFPYTQQETREFLEDVSDLEDSVALWDAKSGVPGLLNAVPKTSLLAKQEDDEKSKKDKRVEKIISTFLLIYFIYNIEQGLFRYGYFSPITLVFRLIPAKRVRLGVTRMAKTQAVQMRLLTARLVNGEISQQYWYNQMRKMMLDQYRASYIASIGGVGNYNRSEVSRFGWMVRPQYRWLDNFLDELNSGKQPLNGFAVNRAGMYARAGNAIYQASLFSIAERNGMTQAKRILGATEDHCHDRKERPGCIELAALGYVPMSQAVPIGDASCYSNCLCSWRFK